VVFGYNEVGMHRGFWSAIEDEKLENFANIVEVFLGETCYNTAF